MESARLPRSFEPVRTAHLGLVFALLLLAAIGWAVADVRMAGMDAGPGTELGTLGFWVTAWIAMMAAMIAPSIAPMVLIHARIQEGKRERGKDVAPGTTAAFVCGYLITWTAAGLAGYAVFQAGRSVSIEALSWGSGGPYLAGGVILAAALYQLTPLKDACLRRCRSFMFLLTAWRPGRLGALRMGLEHGGWCVGCCWALMAALFALGVMSIGWMVFVAALVATEKLLPWKAAANRGIAVPRPVGGDRARAGPGTHPPPIPRGGGGHGGDGRRRMSAAESSRIRLRIAASVATSSRCSTGCRGCRSFRDPRYSW